LVIVIVVSPFIFYRPMMAWLSSVLGRSSQFRTAFARTRGNYWNMVAIGTVFNLTLALLGFTGREIGVGSWLLTIVGSPLVIYFNVLLAKIYEHFFLEIDNEG